MSMRNYALPFFIVLAAGLGASNVTQALTFYHTITGEDLKLPDTAPTEGRDTEAVRKFLETGINLYNEVPGCLPEGEQTYLASCSGCHGHVGEGKVGPGLNDAYWTYPKNRTDKGLIETIYGGAQGMMGPHNDLKLDESLKLVAWIRHLYTGDVAEAEWLSDDQKKKFKPYAGGHGSGDQGEPKPAAAECKISAG